MAPIHDTDVATERWEQDSWRNLELWEKVQARFQRNRVRLFILFGVLGLLLMTVPSIVTQTPKWDTYQVINQVAMKIIQIKSDAVLSYKAIRMEITDIKTGAYEIKSSDSCQSQNFVNKEEGTFSFPSENYLTFISPELGASIGIPHLTLSFCYDPKLGADYMNTTGFAVIPVKDLSTSRLDRISVLSLSGESAEISYD
ncbi:MAG: hypothetical protein CL678_13575 [Bdellovibrionaceae bacterium]|nr:hypothetical protein [Pseudobdellovibrionaceae bacterium]|tara:strand:+ start:3001 stop:3597 length:597 start_codon:yes stop_codon:yes gene_type:complete